MVVVEGVVAFDDVVVCVVGIGIEFGVAAEVNMNAAARRVRGRLDAGWDETRAISTPTSARYVGTS